jgi:hypothetical protein
MARGKTIVKKSAVQRATGGLLAAAAAAGVNGIIEVHLETGVVRFQMVSEKAGEAPAKADPYADEWK